ncbi:MAG TPA: endonuclease/exonuclease/phosphatase family protein [Acidimicrobiia bacterium]
MIVVALPAAALAVITVAAFFGRFFWVLDVLANFRPQYVVALLVLGAVLMMGRWRRFGAVILAAAAVNLVVVLPLFVGNPGDSDPSRPSVTVMTFNLRGSANEQYGEVLEFIQQRQPDLVLLHEAYRPWELAVEPLGAQYRIVRPRADELIFGTLVLVKGQLLDWQSHGFASAEPRAVELVFVPQGWETPLTVLSSHPNSPTDSVRASIRDEQLEFAAGWAEDREGPLLVAGDLNATPWSWAFRKLEGAGLRNSGIGFGIQATYPADGNPLLRVPIDHVLHSSQLGVRSRELGPALGSDHFPVIVELELRS